MPGEYSERKDSSVSLLLAAGQLTKTAHLPSTSAGTLDSFSGGSFCRLFQPGTTGLQQPLLLVTCGLPQLLPGATPQERTLAFVDSAPIPRGARGAFSHPLSIAHVNSFWRLISFLPRPATWRTKTFANSKTMGSLSFPPGASDSMPQIQTFFPSLSLTSNSLTNPFF